MNVVLVHLAGKTLKSWPEPAKTRESIDGKGAYGDKSSLLRKGIHLI